LKYEDENTHKLDKEAKLRAEDAYRKVSRK